MPADKRPIGEKADIAFTLLWFATGTAWTLQLFLPWTTVGVFSSSSMIDGIQLLRSSDLSGVPSGWAHLVLLAIPAVGLLVAGSAGINGTWMEWVRLLLSAAVALMFVNLVQNVAGADIGRLGPGAWVTIVGILLAGFGLIGRSWWLRDHGDRST